MNLIRAAGFGGARSPVACARLLLTRGADPNRLVYDQTSALHQAVIHSQVDLVRLLLEFGADPFVRLDDGPNEEDALELARFHRPQGVVQDRQAIVELLLASAQTRRGN
ncbi:ankyrin repeat domain-containing protein [Aquabacterium sp. A7-Y]|nr:ankyrin repeat domain-containing protein [Aquabacterium sp. A7-Y]MCW7541024.1 ankyrin repeat domain-containing protein [Aquabacterium sp. A7-Y]